MEISEIARDAANHYSDIVSQGGGFESLHHIIQAAIDEACKEKGECIEELKQFIYDHVTWDGSYGSRLSQQLLKIEYDMSPNHEGFIVTWDDGQQEGCPTCKHSKILKKGKHYLCRYSDDANGYGQYCKPEPRITNRPDERNE